MRNVSIVVINKNQLESLKEMVTVLKTLLPNFSRFFVLDRCTDGSSDYLNSIDETYIERHNAIGFCAGSARNLGLSITPEDSDVLFFDGDRIPLYITEQHVYDALDAYDLTLIKNDNDSRSWFTSELTPNPKFGRYINEVWSSAFTIRRTAINNILTLNNGNLFYPEFDGRWGCEDTYLGDQLYHLNLTCGGMSNEICVRGKTTQAKLTPDLAHQNKLRSKLRASLKVKYEPDLNQMTDVDDQPKKTKFNGVRRSIVLKT